MTKLYDQTVTVEDTEQWQKLIQQEIPISAALGFSLTELTPEKCVGQAPLSNNINIHHTAFAGSIYAICTLTAWTFINYNLKRLSVKADVVLRQGDVRYKRPIITDIIAEARLSDEQLVDNFQVQFDKHKRFQCPVAVTIRCQQKLAAIFQGDFVAIGKH